MDYCGPKGLPLSEFLSWSQPDQDNALWWQAYESRRCGGCGTHPDDWDDPYAFHAESYTCRGCEFIQAKRDAVADSPGQHIRLSVGAVNNCRRCKPRG
jgi:hypothetical protein